MTMIVGFKPVGSRVSVVPQLSFRVASLGPFSPSPDQAWIVDPMRPAMPRFILTAFA